MGFRARPQPLDRAWIYPRRQSCRARRHWAAARACSPLPSFARSLDLARYGSRFEAVAATLEGLVDNAADEPATSEYELLYDPMHDQVALSNGEVHERLGAVLVFQKDRRE